MATTTVTFTSMPSLPTAGITQEELQLLSATRDNINLLIGATNKAGAAVLRGSITTKQITKTNFNGLSAKGGGFIISNVQVASAVEFNNLILDVQKLARDVENLRKTLNTLISQLKV